MLGLEMLGDFAGVFRFVVLLHRKADAKSLHRLGGVLLHQGDDEGRIDAAGEERPQRHVAPHPHRDGGFQQLPQPLRRISFADADLVRKIGPPVGLHFQLVVLPLGVVPGREFAIAFENAVGVRDVLIGQVFVDGSGVDFPRQARQRKQALELAGEEQPARLVAVDERLFAQPVAAEDQAAVLGVPDGDGEHAVEMREALRPFVFIEVNDAFGVALGAELVPRPFQPPPQVAVVVDLAVEDDPNRFVLVSHRLVAAGQVDDREPPKAEGDARLGLIRRAEAILGEVRSLVIRPPMPQGVRHPLKLRLFQPQPWIIPNSAGDAAHGEFFAGKSGLEQASYYRHSVAGSSLPKNSCRIGWKPTPRNA